MKSACCDAISMQHASGRGAAGLARARRRRGRDRDPEAHDRRQRPTFDARHVRRAYSSEPRAATPCDALGVRPRDLPRPTTLALGLALALGCAQDRDRGSDPAPPEQTAPAVVAPEQPGAEPRPSTDDADPCDPLPQAGQPCHREGSVCPIDWGEPCGASTAAWCERGVWRYEEEANLCDDEPIP